MTERGGHRRRPSPPRNLLVAAPVAALAVVLAGCSSGSEEGAGNAGCPAPSAAPAAETALMPSGLSFDKVGTVTHVQDTTGHVTVRAVADRPLDEVTVLIQDAVTAAGYRPAGMENEGHEAEVFFTSGSYAAGQARVRPGGCQGRWNIELVLVDLDAVPSSTAPATTTQ